MEGRTNIWIYMHADVYVYISDICLHTLVLKKIVCSESQKNEVLPRKLSLKKAVEMQA